MAKETAAYVRREDGLFALYWPSPRWIECTGCKHCWNRQTFHLRGVDTNIHSLFEEWDELARWAKLRGMGPLSMVD